MFFPAALLAIPLCTPPGIGFETPFALLLFGFAALRVGRSRIGSRTYGPLSSRAATDVATVLAVGSLAFALLKYGVVYALVPPTHAFGCPYPRPQYLPAVGASLAALALLVTARRRPARERPADGG